MGHLTKTSLNGQLVASYEYDAYGNRTSFREDNAKTSYMYDDLDRLTEAKELDDSVTILRAYDYDKRGNQIKEFLNGNLQKTFTFDATNMLAKVVDADKGELENQYNGLGFRVASTRPEEKIEYLCDLSRDYYNLLERTVNGETESFIYDNNVVSMSKAGNNYYYLQDELGSPMYMTGTDGAAVSSYAFDDFGRNIDPFTGKVKEHKHAYTTNGNILQPFAFTGYQEDEVSGLKFAQARFYDANTGRFQSEDNVKGFIDRPYTMNIYSYCFGNAISFVDRNGKSPTDCEDDESNTYVYDRDAIRKYAKQYAEPRKDKSSTDEYIYSLLHPGFRNGNYVNLRTTNCANFVSQCIVAGGVCYNDDWYHHRNEYKMYNEHGYAGSIYTYDYSLTWSMASAQYEYFSNPDNGFVNTKKVEFNNAGVSQSDSGVIKITSAAGVREAVAEANIQTGDLVYFINEDGKVHHAAIVSDVSDDDILYAGNTKRRFDESLSDAIGPNGEYGVVIVRINDELGR